MFFNVNRRDKLRAEKKIRDEKKAARLALKHAQREAEEQAELEAKREAHLAATKAEFDRLIQTRESSKNGKSLFVRVPGKKMVNMIKAHNEKEQAAQRQAEMEAARKKRQIKVPPYSLLPAACLYCYFANIAGTNTDSVLLQYLLTTITILNPILTKH